MINNFLSTFAKMLGINCPKIGDIVSPDYFKKKFIDKEKWHKWYAWYPVWVEMKDGNYKRTCNKLVLRKYDSYYGQYNDFPQAFYLSYEDFGDPESWSTSEKK